MSISPVNGIGYSTPIRQAKKVSNNQSFKGAGSEESQGMSKTGKIATAIGIVGVAALAVFGVYKHRNAKSAEQAVNTVQKAASEVANNVERKSGDYSKFATEVSSALKSVVKSNEKVLSKSLKKGKDGVFLLKGKPYTGFAVATPKVKGKDIKIWNEYSNGVLQKSYTIAGNGTNKFVKIVTFDKDGKAVSNTLCNYKMYYNSEVLADGKKVVTKALNPGNKSAKVSAKEGKNVIWTSAGPVAVKSKKA